MKNKKKADEWLEGVEARIEELEKEQLWMGEAPISEYSSCFLSYDMISDPFPEEDSVYHKRWTSNAGEIKALGKQLKDQPYRAYKEAWKEYNQYFPDVKVKYCADKLSVRRESDGKVFQM